MGGQSILCNEGKAYNKYSDRVNDLFSFHLYNSTLSLSGYGSVTERASHSVGSLVWFTESLLLPPLL